jgi:5'-methylthioadenosine phosphorylase
MKIGIIGSTGFDIELLVSNYKEDSIDIYGNLIKYKHSVYKGNEIYFFKRNNYGNPIQPKNVKYKEIVFSMKILGVDIILATAVVGSLSEKIKPESYVIIDQFIDFTLNREKTYFNESNFNFVDFTNPYCTQLRKLFIESCDEKLVNYSSTGCYVCVDGPRYETAAEVKAYSILGGEIIGMTSATEAIMAREAGLCYSSLAFVSNYGAGIKNKKIINQEIYNNNINNTKITSLVFKQVLEKFNDDWKCDCCGE